MKNSSLLILFFLALNLTGCSIPAYSRYSQIQGLTKEEKVTKGAMGFKKKDALIRDFRENEMYIEDLTALQEEAEKYISLHPELNDEQKNNLRELKVTLGDTKDEVLLLLGDPDKITKSAKSETWIYRISKLRAFTFFIFPFYFAHEGYYLRFQGDQLVAIERHYPRQVLHQASAPGIVQFKK